MAAQSKKPATPLKDNRPKREPVSFDIAEAVESGGRWPYKEDDEEDEGDEVERPA